MRVVSYAFKNRGCVLVLVGLVLTLLMTMTTVVHAADDDCESENEALSQNDALTTAQTNVMTSVDPLICDEGNKEGTKLVCGHNYELFPPSDKLFTDYQTACKDAGGQFQTAHAGVVCEHDDKVEIDYDWLNIPDCVGISCPSDYVQTNYVNDFFVGYQAALEADNYTCTITSTAARNGATRVLWKTIVFSMYVGVLLLMT